MKVHILNAGLALCGAGMPNDWPAGDRWVRLEERADATCQACLAAIPLPECECGARLVGLPNIGLIPDGRVECPGCKKVLSPSKTPVLGALEMVALLGKKER